MRYFGYGNLAHERLFSAVIGRPASGGLVFLSDHDFCIQRLEHITDRPPAAGGESPRALLRRVWGPAFSSYVIQPSSRTKPGHVIGRLYQVNEIELEIIRAFELVPNWMRAATVTVHGLMGADLQAETEVLGPGQKAVPVQPEVWAPAIVGDPDEFCRIAERSRLSYLSGM